VLNRGDRISFQVRDVYLPGANEVLQTLTQETEVVGTLIDFSDSGPRPGVFAVVGLGGDNKVIVPVSKLRSVGP